MTYHREHFERVYALTERVAPASLMRESDEAEADRFLISKEVSFFGLSPLRWTSDAFHGRGEPDRAAKKMLGAMVTNGDLIEVQVEGWKMVHYALGTDEAFAEALAGGLARFVRFLGASKLDAMAIGEPLLRRRSCSSQGATEGEA